MRTKRKRESKTLIEDLPNEMIYEIGLCIEPKYVVNFASLSKKFAMIQDKEFVKDYAKKWKIKHDIKEIRWAYDDNDIFHINTYRHGLFHGEQKSFYVFSSGSTYLYEDKIYEYGKMILTRNYGNEEVIKNVDIEDKKGVLNGRVTHYRVGNLIEEVDYKNMKFREYYLNGNLKHEYTFDKEDHIIGPFRKFYEDGELEHEGYYTYVTNFAGTDISF